MWSQLRYAIGCVWPATALAEPIATLRRWWVARYGEAPVSKAVEDEPLTTRERVCYSVFNGADYLIKNIIGKYMFSG